MADLDEKHSSQAVKITGADSEGSETNYASVNEDQEVLTYSQIERKQMLYLISLLYDLKEEIQKLNKHMEVITNEETKGLL